MTSGELTEWLRERVAHRTEQRVETIRSDTRFEASGLDSVGLVGLSGDLEEKLNRRVNPEWMYEYETLQDLARFLTEQKR